MAYIIQSENKNWGIGHQIKNIWSGIILSELLGLTFLQSNLKGDWARWTDFLNYNDGYSTLQQIESSGINLEEIKIKHGGYDGTDLKYFEEIIMPHINKKNVLFNLIRNTRFMLHQIPIHLRNRIVKELRFKYDKKRKENSIILPFDKNKINVAIHFRRGDINKKYGGIRSKMWIDVEYFINIINNIKSIKNKEFDFYLYTGECNETIKILNNFNDIKCRDVFDRKTEKEFIGFHEMLNADILVTAPSNLSYVVGELSGKIVINLTRIQPHPNGRYSLTTFSKPVKKIESTEEGNFNINKLQEYLNEI